MTVGVVLTGASARVATTPSAASPAGSVSILVTAKVLGEIDLLIAKCCVDVVRFNAPAQRDYELVTSPIRLDTLSGDPAVVIRASGSVERIDMVVAMRFEIEDRSTQRGFVFDHNFGDVCLTAAAPVITRRLPLSRFRSGQSLGSTRAL